ncbi:helix-turn-helix domain-containing protein [Halomarina ordinaria]|uniref:Helix-turn-helix domain-containing protein n=1 Tax=Halomarina ordinaria TaxID=3033939 RepID=A0ABD5U4P9_9EURY|nr:helix-turn-helix domain-containing protein [Halomarina sp. PSRA2]
MADDGGNEPVIVRFTLQQPTLLWTLRRCPTAEVLWEQSDVTPNGEQLLLCWVETDDYDAFEATLYDDPTVTAPRRLIEFSDRRLYQVEQVGEGRARSIYPTIAAVGGIIHRCVGTGDGWSYQVTFPDHDALEHFHAFCTEHDLGFRLVRKFEQVGEREDREPLGLTEKQYRMLTYAVEEGYYEIPRRTDLATLAERMDISHQAVSERLRRAINALVHATVDVEG